MLIEGYIGVYKLVQLVCFLLRRFNDPAFRVLDFRLFDRVTCFWVIQKRTGSVSQVVKYCGTILRNSIV